MSLWLSLRGSRVEERVMPWEGGKRGEEREEEKKGRKGELSLPKALL